MNVRDKDLLQSYLLTVSKYDYSVHEKRILYRLVEYCQYQLENKKITKDIRIDKSLIDTYEIEVPLNEFAKNGELDRNHLLIKKALKSLQTKIFEFQEGDTWESISIIANPKFKNKSGKIYVKFLVDEKIYNTILDFSKGFRRIGFVTAMSLESTYAMRFYELMGSKNEPIRYSVDSLKEMFKLVGKYSKANDFKKRVLDVAKKELDKSSPVSFDYKPYKKGRKIVGYEFFPKKIKENQNDAIEANKLKKKVSPQWELSRPVLDFLRNMFKFENKEIQRQIDLFKLASVEIEDFMSFLSKVYTKSQEPNIKSPKGYLINALKKETSKS